METPVTSVRAATVRERPAKR